MSTYSYLNIGASRPGVSWGFNGSPPQRCCLPSGCSMPSVCRPLVCHIPLQLGIESPGRGVVGFIFRTYFLGSSILWNILENPWTGLIELNFVCQFFFQHLLEVIDWSAETRRFLEKFLSMAKDCSIEEPWNHPHPYTWLKVVLDTAPVSFQQKLWTAWDWGRFQ